MTRLMTENKKLVQCGDHGFAPWGIICIHIIDGTAKEVVATPQDAGSEVENDWLCPECAERHCGPNSRVGDIDDLRCVCVHCLRKLVEPYLRDEESR